MPDTTTRSLTVRVALEELTDRLANAGIADPRQEARDLIAAVLDVPRLWPTAHHGEPIEAVVLERMRRAAERRAGGAPFAYAVGRAAFRHLTLEVDECVLIPRQETEVLVDEVLAIAGEWDGTAVDVGTGSGAIALALATEGRFTGVIATDVSREALEVAARNVARLRPATPIELRHGALLAPLAGERARVIVSNPPNIAYDEAPALPPSVRNWEPPVALFSARGGMAATAAVIRAAAPRLEPGGLLALEVDARRASLAAELAMASGYYDDVRVRLDLAGRERILLARRTNR